MISNARDFTEDVHEDVIDDRYSKEKSNTNNQSCGEEKELRKMDSAGLGEVLAICCKNFGHIGSHAGAVYYQGEDTKTMLVWEN